MRLLAFVLALALIAGAAHAEPVSIIGAVSAAAAAAAGSATVTILGVTVALSTVLTVVGTALSLIAGVITTLARSRNQDSAAQSEQRSRKFSTHPQFRFAFGEFPQEGDVVFHYTKGQNYYLTLLLNSVPSEAIDRIEINDGVVLTLLSDGSNDLTDMTKGAGVSEATWSGALRFWAGMGEQTSPPSAWESEIGEVIRDTDAWTGSTVLHIKMTYGTQAQAVKRWQGVPPPFRIMGRWAKLYDPRLDSSSGVSGASGSHDPDDRTTWEWSANPALAGLMLVRHRFALGFDDEMIPIQQWADAADACDADGGSASTQVLNQPWTGSDPATQVVGQNAGSGVWTQNRGTCTTTTGVKDANNGNPVLKMVSTDADGSLIPSEYARCGVYIDLGSDGPHEITRTGFFTGTTGQGRVRYKIYEADPGGSASEADQQSTFMPPDAANISLVYDRGDVGFPSSGSTATHTVNGRYVSFVIEGGGPVGDFIEVSAISWTSDTDYGEKFRCDGLVGIAERELSILDPVLDCMAGHLDTTDGMLGVRAGVWSAATGALSQPIGDEIELQGARDSGFDKVISKIVGRHRNYEETDGPGWEVRTGSRVHPLHLPLVREPYQAGRLEKIYAGRSEPARKLIGEWDGREYSRRVGERVTASLPGFTRASATYVIDSKQINFAPVDDGVKVSVNLTLVQDDQDTYSWSSDDYDPPDAYVPPSQTTPNVVAPTGCELTTEERTEPGENNATYLQICQQFLPVEGADYYQIEITEAQYNTVGNENETVGPTTYRVQIPADQTVDDGGTEKVRWCWERPALPNVEYTFKVWSSALNLGQSDDYLECSITPSPGATPTATLTLIGSTHDDVHTATHTIKQAADIDMRYIELYAGNASDRSDLVLVDTVAALNAQTVDLLDDGAFAGTRYLRAYGIDRWGQQTPALDFDYTPTTATSVRLLEDGGFRLLEGDDQRLLE